MCTLLDPCVHHREIKRKKTEANQPAIDLSLSLIFKYGGTTHNIIQLNRIVINLFTCVIFTLIFNLYLYSALLIILYII